MKRHARLNADGRAKADPACREGGSQGGGQPCPCRWCRSELQLQGAGTNQPVGQEHPLGLHFPVLTAALQQVPVISLLARRKPK